MVHLTSCLVTVFLGQWNARRPTKLLQGRAAVPRENTLLESFVCQLGYRYILVEKFVSFVGVL